MKDLLLKLLITILVLMFERVLGLPLLFFSLVFIWGEKFSQQQAFFWQVVLGIALAFFYLLPLWWGVVVVGTGFVLLKQGFLIDHKLLRIILLTGVATLAVLFTSAILLTGKVFFYTVLSGVGAIVATRKLAVKLNKKYL